MSVKSFVYLGLALIPVTFSILGGCGPSPPSLPDQNDKKPPWFADVTQEVGLNFVHEIGTAPLDTFFLPHIMGSGAALFDFNNDGRLDILLIQNGGPNSQAVNRLFRQDPDGHFTDVTAGSGLGISGYGMGVAIGDVNNDGWPDVLVTEFGGIHLFLNNGNGTFADVTKESGLDNPHWATSACFVDYDRDGWLDLVVVNFVDYDPTVVCNVRGGPKQDYCHPKIFSNSVTKLFHNLGGVAGSKGKFPRFADVTLASGLGKLPGPGLGVVCADFDGDGWPDIFVANDSHANHLWINQHDGTFKEEAIQRGLAYNAMGSTQANMGIALGDVDGDGLFDLFVTHLTEETNTLWKQKPRGLFQDLTGQSRLLHGQWPGTGFGTVFGDFDQDGHLDLALVNGRVARGAPAKDSSLPPFLQPYAERNQLFANTGDGTFRDISSSNPPFCDTPALGRGLASGVFTDSGALDLLVTNVAGPAQLLRNVTPQRGHWLLVRALEPTLGGRYAYGATVIVRAGEKRWVSWVNPGQSYLCSNDPRAHFGLGAIDAIASIEVQWPNGDKEMFEGCPADREVTLNHGRGNK
jgi:hypothetical protein